MNGYNRKSPQKRRYDMPKYAGKSNNLNASSFTIY